MTSATRTLGRGGLRVGANSFGVAPIANLARVVSDADVAGALEAAWAEGVRYFDTAPHYGLGLAEERLGEFLRTKPRYAFIVSTKVGRLLVKNPLGAQLDDDGFAMISALTRRRDYSGDGIRLSIDQSLERMGLHRIYVASVHEPHHSYREALKGLSLRSTRFERRGLFPRTVQE